MYLYIKQIILSFCSDIFMYYGQIYEASVITLWLHLQIHLYMCIFPGRIQNFIKTSLNLRIYLVKYCISQKFWDLHCIFIVCAIFQLEIYKFWSSLCKIQDSWNQFRKLVKFSELHPKGHHVVQKLHWIVGTSVKFQKRSHLSIILYLVTKVMRLEVEIHKISKKGTSCQSNLFSDTLYHVTSRRN